MEWWSFVNVRQTLINDIGLYKEEHQLFCEVKIQIQLLYKQHALGRVCSFCKFDSLATNQRAMEADMPLNRFMFYASS